VRRRIDTYSGVLFDCDDTIIETAKTRWSVMIATARTFDCDIDERDIRAVWGFPFEKMIRTLLPGVEYDEYVSSYRAAMRQNPPKAAPGARRLLSYLREQDVQMRILTSSRRDLIVQDLDDLDLRCNFSEIYGHEQTMFHKPDPRALRRPIDDFVAAGIANDDIVYIGDSVRDHLVARGNGLPFIGVTSGLESSSDLRQAGVEPEMIVASLAELIPESRDQESVSP
jgi:phosphoglycolate phosphatase-like HAD superfamily hydrolase